MINLNQLINLILQTTVKVNGGKNENAEQIFSVIAGVITATIVCSGSVYAAAICNAATINWVEARPDVTLPANASMYVVNMQCPEWDANTYQFYISTDIGDSGYATVLTAMSLDTTMKVFVESKTWNGLMTRVGM